MARELTPEQKFKLEEFLAGIDLFASIEPNMPLQMLRTFLFVAIYEGEGSVELGDKMGLPSGVASRHLGDWGPYDRYKKPSHNFIEGKTPIEDRRVRKQYLTPDGRAFLHRLLRAIRA